MKSALEEKSDRLLAREYGIRPEDITLEFIRGIRHARQLRPDLPAASLAKAVLKAIALGINVCACGSGNGESSCLSCAIS